MSCATCLQLASEFHFQNNEGMSEFHFQNNEGMSEIIYICILLSTTFLSEQLPYYYLWCTFFFSMS